MSGHAIGAEGLRVARSAPNSALGRRWTPGARSPARSSPSWPTTAIPRRRRHADDGRAPGPRRGLAGQHLQPRGRGRRRRGDRRRRAAAGPGARGGRAPCAADQSRGRAARVGPLRRRVRDARRGVHGARPGRGGGRDERAAHRLPDADRQPRGRHAARALGAARSRRDRLRGHAHDEGAARPLRGVGRARALRRACRAARGAAPGGADALGRRRGARQRCRHAARERSGAGARAGVHGGGARGRGAAGPQRGAGRAGGVGHGGRDVALRRLPAAQEGALSEVFASPEVVVAFESPRRVGASLAVLAASTRTGRWPSAAS